MQSRRIKNDVMQEKEKEHIVINSIPKAIWEDAFTAPFPQRKAEFLEYMKKIITQRYLEHVITMQLMFALVN